MSVKKIEFDGKTLIDLTQDTVTADSMLNGVKAHNNEGDIITGNIPTKTAANLTVNGKTVTVPAGYYSTQATKDVATATRAKTTMSSSPATDNSKITITASNNQGTGYVTGSNETASKDVSLTVNGAQITVSDGTSTINQTVPSVARANTTMTSTKSTDNKKITITASNDQKTGYVAGANKTVSRDVTLSISGKTATASDGNFSISQNVADGTAGVPLAVKGVVSGNQIAITPKVTNTTGYITGGEKVGSDVIVKASDLVSGNKALASSSTKQENIDVTNFSTVSIDAIPTSPLTNAIIKSCTMNPTSEPGDEDTARVVVQIPEGFHASQTIQKDFEDLLPGLENPGGADQALNGYKYYDDTGNMITGTMTNNGAVTYDLNDVNKSYTIPKGYHDGKGVVSHTTTNIPNPTMAFNSSTKKVTASGSWTKGYTSNSAYSAAYQVTLDDAKEVTGIGSVAMPTNISKSGATISTGTGTITLTAPVSINATLNKGYIDSASKSYNVTAELEANVNTLAAKDYHPSTSDSVIPQGSYLTGNIVFKGVTTSGIQASNIIKGAVVKVGDKANSGSIANVTGTADYIKTVSSVPASKDTSIIYNSGDGNFYVWRA